MIKTLKYLLPAFAFVFGAASCAIDHEEHDTNTVYYAGSADVTLTVTDMAGKPVAGVSVTQNQFDIDEVTDALGQVSVHLDEAPRALSNVILTHADYNAENITIPIGTVSRHENKEIAYTTPLREKEFIYTATLNVYDNMDFTAVENACVQVLNAPLGEIDAAYSDADGVAVLRLPEPPAGQSVTYRIKLTCEDFEDKEGEITIAYSSLAVKGEPWNTDCGTFTMKYIGEGKIKEPHNEYIEATIEIPYSDTDYSGGQYSFPLSILLGAFGLTDDAFADAVDAGLVTIVGVDDDGKESASNTNANGCWWGEGQKVKGWGADARVFFEGNSYNSFSVGQYPGQCTVGETYPTCHKVSYTDEDGNVWSVTFTVYVKVV